MSTNDFEVDKSSPAGGDEEDRQQEDNPKKRVCAVCDRVFKSGKALGGHMRIHFQVSKKLSLQESSNVRPKHQLPQSPKCSLCPKTFRSMKSMYGHMRCHPERNWRGIQPPRDSTTSPPGAGAGAGLSLLVSWPASCKRGRITGKNNLPVPGNCNCNFMEGDPEFLECVGNLVYLSRAPKIRVDEINPNSYSSSSETGIETQVPESEASILKEFVDECIGYCHPNHLNHDEMSSLENENENVEDELGSKINNQVEDFNISVSPNEKVINFNQKKKTKLVDMPGVASISSKNMKSVMCSICPKSFLTYHGLGGHMSIHSKERIVNHIFASASAKVVVNRPVQQKKRKESDQESELSSDTGLHQCRVCRKNFSSGQALGGHKKCHRSVTLSIEEPIAGISPNYRDGNLDIDLNELPPEAEKDEGRR